MRVRMPWKGIRSSEGIVDVITFAAKIENRRNTCSSLRRSGKSYGTTTGCKKTLSCRGEVVVVETRNGRD